MATMPEPPDPIALTLSFVSQPSASGDTSAENAMADRVAAALEQIGLAAHFWPTSDGRKSVWSLWRGADAPVTSVLLSHFDTVGVGEYGRAGLPDGAAFDPAALAELFGEAADDEVRADAASETYLFGRGALDMKSGIAAQIAALATKPKANVLFLSCPDEEAGSAGILQSLRPLRELVEREGLSLRAVINSDYTAPRYPGDTARYLYLGTVGKLLPSFYVAGVETHVGEPYRGQDACHIAAEIVREVSLNPRMCDRAGREVTVPPIPLHLRDMKEAYNVQTALEAHMYFNYMTHSVAPREVLEKMRRFTQAAVRRYMGRRRQTFERYTAGREHAALSEAEIPVIIYDELPEPARAAATGALSGLEKDSDPRVVSLELVRTAAREAGLRRPYILIYLSPPYFPHVRTTARAFRKWAVGLASRFDCELRDFYPYISDVSYVGGVADPSQAEQVRANLPQWGVEGGYRLPDLALLGLRCPIVNIGPWGKGAHGLYERVERASVYRARDMILVALAQP
jgi:arginine utilization protein RocB